MFWLPGIAAVGLTALALWLSALVVRREGPSYVDSLRWFPVSTATSRPAPR